MKSKWILIFLLTLSGVEACFAQEEKKQFIHKGLLRAMATISVGSITKASLHGNLEYYVADNTSLRGDTYYSLKTNTLHFADLSPYLVSNHQTFAGASYHFKTKNHFDPYFGFQPGFALSQSNSSKQTINPLLSPVLGFNIYFEKLFHLFAETRYVIGNHLSEAHEPISLNELRFSFGLGFNLSVFSPKKG